MTGWGGPNGLIRIMDGDYADAIAGGKDDDVGGISIKCA